MLEKVCEKRAKLENRIPRTGEEKKKKEYGTTAYCC